MFSKKRMKIFLCAVLSLAPAITGCVKPPGGTAVVEDMSMEDMQSTPDMAEAPVDMGFADAPADMPDEEMDAPDAGMVCEPNMARCASESVREVCTEDGAGMRAEPCDAGEVCVGDGACTLQCGKGAGKVCSIERFVGSMEETHTNGCLGRSLVVWDDFIFAGDPCATIDFMEAGIVQMFRVENGKLSATSVLHGASSQGGRFGTSLVLGDEELFVGDPGLIGGSIHYFAALDEIAAERSSVVQRNCTLAPDVDLDPQAWGEVLAILPEERLLFVADPEWTSNVSDSMGRVYVYEIAAPVDCDDLASALQLKARIEPPADETVFGFGAALEVRKRLVDGNSKAEIFIGAPGEDGALFVASVNVSALQGSNESAFLRAMPVAHGDALGVEGLGAAITLEAERERVYVSAIGAEDKEAFYAIDFDGETPELIALNLFDPRWGDADMGIALHSPAGKEGFWAAASAVDGGFLVYVDVASSGYQGSVSWEVEASELLEDVSETPPTNLGASMITVQDGRYLIAGAPDWGSDNRGNGGALFSFDLGEQ